MAKDSSLTFFSYSREDSQFALLLAKDLRTSGATVWLDQLDISPGQRWDKAVEDALANCPRMLIVLSPSSVDSNNVLDEVSFALEERKNLIPVLYRDCKIPFRLRRLQYVDFRTDYATGLSELLETLEVDNPNQAPQTVQEHTADEILDVPKKPVGLASHTPAPELREPAAASISVTAPVDSLVGEKPAPPIAAGMTSSESRVWRRLPQWFWFGALALGLVIMGAIYWNSLKSEDSTKSVASKKASAGEISKGPSAITDAPLPVNPVVLPKPPFQYTSRVGKTEAPSTIRLQKISQKPNKITDDEKWFSDNQLSLPVLEVPNPLYGRKGNVPPAVPKTYGKEDILVTLIQDNNHWLAGYARDFSGTRYLMGYDSRSGKLIFAYDFQNYLMPNEYVQADRNYISELVKWAHLEGNILYVSNSHNTYSKSSRGWNGYLNAIDIRSNQLLWRSRPLVSNSSDFAIYKDAIITGYGFTAEPHFLYVLDKRDGSIVQTIPVVKSADHILIKGDLAYVRTYDTDYVFRIVEQ